MQRRLLGHIKRGHVRAMINQYLYSVSPSDAPRIVAREVVIVLSIYISIEMDHAITRAAVWHLPAYATPDAKASYDFHPVR